ncbi:hypothetical protein L6259_00060 [Candidatus Parcubacteria bacterium]|nr:hypothetical protein [Patescibacteria group bacterium]MCG2693674.1 hypothetical protein [Candidatus Parcubacteria bacterium]
MEYPKAKICNCGHLPRHAHLWLGSHIKMGHAFTSMSKGVLRTISYYKIKVITHKQVDALCREISLLGLPDTLGEDIDFNH